MAGSGGRLTRLPAGPDPPVGVGVTSWKVGSYMLPLEAVYYLYLGKVIPSYYRSGVYCPVARPYTVWNISERSHRQQDR